MLYSDKVLEHFANPHKDWPEMEGNIIPYIGGEEEKSEQEPLRLWGEIKDGVIEDAKFKTFGCGAAVATSSMATELVKGKTLLVIAHRLNTVRSADQILVISEGEISQRGTHQSMMEEDGIYRNFVIVRQQSRGWNRKAGA